MIQYMRSTDRYESFPFYGYPVKNIFYGTYLYFCSGDCIEEI